MTFEKIMIAIQYGQTIRCHNETSPVRFVAPASARQDIYQTGLAHVVFASGKQTTVLTSDLELAR